MLGLVGSGAARRIATGPAYLVLACYYPVKRSDRPQGARQTGRNELRILNAASGSNTLDVRVFRVHVKTSKLGIEQRLVAELMMKGVV